MKAKINGVQHIGVPTKDMKASAEFYQALGFEEAFGTVNDGSRVKFFRLNNLVMEVYESEDATMRYGAIDHVALDVADIEETYKEVCAMGLNTLNDQIHFLPFWDNGVKFFTIEGPNKERIEFSQML